MENRRYTTTETIVGLVFFALVLWAAFFLFKSIFSILAWAAPILFIAALIINYKLVLSYGKMLVVLVKRNTLVGIVAIILTFVAFPIVAALLFAMALMNKKADSILKEEIQKKEGIPTDYTEISSEAGKQYDDLFGKK